MALQATIEQIWHFVGYLRVLDFVGRDQVSYLGAPEYKSAPYEPHAGGAEPDFNPSFADVAGIAAARFAGPPFIVEEGRSIALGPAPTKGAQKAPIVADAVDGPFAPPVQLSLQSVASITPQDATAQYWYGASQYHDIAIIQTNDFNDDDLVIANADYVDAADLEAAQAHRDAADDAVADMIDVAESLLPAEIAALFADHPGDVGRAIAANGEGRPEISDASGSSDGLVAVENGRYVNGEQIASGPEAASDQVARVLSARDKVGADEDDAENDDGGADNEAEAGSHNGTVQASASGGSASAQGWAPPAPSQTTAVGDNTSVNAVVLQDFNDVYGSRIVLGDHKEVNLIAQINVFRGLDATSDGADWSHDAIADVVAGNQFRNEATLSTEPGSIYGNVAAGGFPFATDWKVDYTDGDLYDVTVVTQHNVMSDDDIQFGAPTQATYTTETGANGQLNSSSLLELGKKYDLIIVGGDVVEYDAIVQMNILYDADMLAQFDAGPGVEQSVAGHDNQLTNDAAIYSTGGASYKPITEEAQDLAGLIADGESDIPAEMMIGLPGNGDDEFNVLYVSGHHYTYNFVLQSNTMSDADYSLDGLGSGDGSQQMTAGGNKLINAAVINEQDSTSDYQYLGGEFSTEMLLIQANIIEGEENPSVNAGGLHEDVVAALAAADDDEMNDVEAPDVSAALSALGGDVDVLGGVTS